MDPGRFFVFVGEICYTAFMRNWSTDTTELKKDPEKLAIWKLEQMVNFGLQGERISAAILEKYFERIVIDPARRAYLTHLLNVA